MSLLSSLPITCFFFLLANPLPANTLQTASPPHPHIGIFNSSLDLSTFSSVLYKRQLDHLKLLSFDDHAHFLMGDLTEHHSLLKRQAGWTHLEPNHQVSVAGFDASNNHDSSYLNTTIVKGPYSVQIGAPSWGLSRISQRHLPLVNAFAYPEDAGQDVDIFIVDSGVDMNHKDFDGRISLGGNFVPGSSDKDENGHGTIIAGIAAGTSFGVAKKANIISIKCLTGEGTGNVDVIIEGLHYIHQRIRSQPRKSIVNLSVVAEKSDALNLAVDALTRAGAIVVGAAGNYHEGDDAKARNSCNYSPASASSVISVGSTDEKDQFASFSKDGQCVTILAPGAAILSDTRTNSNPSGLQTWYSGTSYSAPHVSGIAALLFNQLSPGARLNSTLDNNRVIQQIYALATKDIVKNVPRDTVNLLAYSGVETSSQVSSVTSASNHQGSAGAILVRPLFGYWLLFFVYVLL